MHLKGVKVMPILVLLFFVIAVAIAMLTIFQYLSSFEFPTTESKVTKTTVMDSVLEFMGENVLEVNLILAVALVIAVVAYIRKT